MVAGALAGLTALAGCSDTTTLGAVLADTTPTSVFAPPTTAT